MVLLRYQIFKVLEINMFTTFNSNFKFSVFLNKSISFCFYSPPNKHCLINKLNSITQLIMVPFCLHFFPNKMSTFHTQVLIKINPILANFFVLVLWQKAHKYLQNGVSQKNCNREEEVCKMILIFF